MRILKSQLNSKCTGLQLLMLLCIMIVPNLSLCQNKVISGTAKQGTFIYQDGSRYNGDLINGVPHGQGTVHYANGNRYTGGWKNHTPNGAGEFYWAATGKKVKAIWELGKLIRVLPVPPQTYKPVSNDNSEKKAMKIWALVVGVSQYKHMNSLQFADDDAYQVYSFLKSPAGGALPKEQVTLLIDEAATRDNMLGALQKLSDKAGPNDVVFVYFSGHGLSDAFLPSDYDGAANKVYHREVVTALNDIKARHKFMIADACHSGNIFQAKSAVNLRLEQLYNAFEGAAGGTALMSSSKCEEYSLEDDRLRSGVFSYYLLKGMSGEADANKDNLVTISELFRYVHQTVRSYTQNLQTPVLRGDFDRNTPVAAVR